ncbi:hypothetical protein BH10PSE2_BH10PSE2_16750 [soil metagenome]
MTDTPIPTSARSNDRRLDLFATLGEAVVTMPVMWRGAGGVLTVLAALWGAALLMAALKGAGGVIGGLTDLATALVALMTWGAITRIGVAGDLAGARRLGLGPFGFQMTRIEARLLGAGALCGLFMIIMLSLLALVALAMFGFAGLNAGAIRAHDWAAVGAAWKLALLAGVGLIVLGVPVVFAVRLCLFAPATVGRGQMISLTATGLTNGAILPLLGGLVVCSVPTLACGVLALAFEGGGGLVPVLWVVSYAGVQAPLTAAFLGIAYRRLETHGMLGAWQ